MMRAMFDSLGVQGGGDRRIRRGQMRRHHDLVSIRCHQRHFARPI